MVNYDKIIDSRENDEDSKYTNKKLQRMIKKRLEKLTGARLKADIHVLEHYWQNHSETVSKGKIIKKGTTND